MRTRYHKSIIIAVISIALYILTIRFKSLVASDTITNPSLPTSSLDNSTIVLDVIIRDFSDTHPDFEGAISWHVKDLVGSTLGDDRKPTFAASNGSGGITSSETFNQWYNDVEGVNQKKVLQLPLTETSPGAGMYIFQDATFFPIDNELLDNQGRPHNYHFTLELHTSFTYRGGETFEFVGDDDVWVFINNQLVVDLGGVHPPMAGSVKLDSLNLTLGATYPLDMFFAERHTTESNFKILTSIDVPTTPFLDLPINYANFEIAAAGSNGGIGPGRVNSWFDHEKPGYRFVRCDKYPKEDKGYFHDNKLTNFTGNPTIPPSNVCDCVLGSSCYDGHDGIDFRHVERGEEAIFSAAPGKVTKVVKNCQASNSCNGFGNQVWIEHENCYETLYGHLKSVESNIVVSYTASSHEKLGIMGNTGNSSGATGVHLHFGVYKDPNCDGNWADKIPVDPYGWLLTTKDPWNYNTKQPLWKYPFRQQERIDSSGGNISTSSGIYGLAIPPNAVNSPLTIEMLPLPPVSEPSAQLQSVGHSFAVRVFEWLTRTITTEVTASANVTEFLQPVTITINYSDTDLKHLSEGNLSISHWDDAQDTWVTLPTSVEITKNLALAQTTNVGSFSLHAPLICPADIHEPDDNYDASTVLTETLSTHIFDISSDEDWFKLFGERGTMYQLKTSSVSNNIKANLELFDADGATMIASSDTGNLAWQVSQDSIYFIRITRTEASAYGCDAQYSLSMTATKLAFLPLIQR